MEQSKKETVLVTGGSGFVGSYCIIQLLPIPLNYSMMILQENYISFEQFVQYFKKLRAKDKVWLISLLYSTSSRNYFEITKDSQFI